jgi:ABC-type multidrug transport system fused ATPase/permease subunit
VLVNGRDIREFSPQSLHGRMSCLFQDYCKYDLTLRDNVGLGDLKRMGEDKTIMTAVERGGAKALHEALGPSTWLTASWPGFANSALNEQGIKKKNKPMTHRRAGATKKKGNWLSDFVEYVFNIQPDTDNKEKKKQDGETCSLSGGQWQRVALSRAFMRADTADLIVFDEPSASLDPIAEATLFDRIHSLSRVGNGATTIFISHRFNTVRRADKIIFVDKGVSLIECTIADLPEDHRVRLS